MSGHRAGLPVAGKAGPNSMARVGPANGGSRPGKGHGGKNRERDGSLAVVETPTKRGSVHVWPGLRCPAKNLGRASFFSSQHSPSEPFGVPGTSRGGEP